MLWRDYFYYLMRNHGAALFYSRGLKAVAPPWQIQPTVIRDWISGRTGEAFIDANMHELLASGYMSNRGRQNVASYLARDLGQHWRVGAEWFEAMLVDYDPASNYGNWTYNTGVGTDPREDRYFNPQSQAEKYDGGKQYRLAWADQGQIPVDPAALQVTVPADA
jgi:deoxyribodipyrimidine photo-lyase